MRSGVTSLSPAFAPLSFVGSAAVAPSTSWFSGFELFGSCCASLPHCPQGLSPLSPQPGLNGGGGGGVAVGPGSEWGLSLVKSNKSPSVELEPGEQRAALPPCSSFTIPMDHESVGAGTVFGVRASPWSWDSAPPLPSPARWASTLPVAALPRTCVALRATVKPQSGFGGVWAACGYGRKSVCVVALKEFKIT